MSCYTCKNFSEFVEARKFDGYSIHGCCFKKSKTASEQYPHGYPVYIPGSECAEYKRDPSKQEPYEERQMQQIRLEV